MKFMIQFWSLIVFLITVSSPLGHAETSFLKPGEVIEYSVGWRDLIAKGEMRFDGGQYRLYVKLGFLGAGLFARTDVKTVQKVSQIENPNPKFFVKGATSFDQIPAIKEKLKQFVALIERQTHSTPYFQVEIDLVMINDADVLSKEDLKERNYNVYSSMLYSRAHVWSKSHQDIVPVFVTALPSRRVVTPNLWDPYGNPLLYAHEFSHLIGVETEGYEYQDYPADGIMNDEGLFNAMIKLGLGSKIMLLRPDFNEMMTNRLSSSVSTKVLRKYFSPLNEDILKEAIDRSAMEPDQIKAFVEEKIRRYHSR